MRLQDKHDSYGQGKGGAEEMSENLRAGARGRIERGADRIFVVVCERRRL